MRDNNIHVMAIPPHTSHILQPLDSTPFAQFKRNWQSRLLEWNYANRLPVPILDHFGKYSTFTISGANTCILIPQKTFSSMNIQKYLSNKTISGIVHCILVQRGHIMASDIQVIQYRHRCAYTGSGVCLY